MVAIAAIFSITIGIIMAVFYRNKQTNVGSDNARGLRNNNPLNLRRTGINWKGEKTEVTDNEFEQFISMMWGLRAGLLNMRTQIKRGYNTIEMLITRWAPPSENNTANYINIVEKESGISRSQMLGFEKDFMFKIVKAMCKIESGMDLTTELYEQAWENI